ncbi:MAG: hypothetical protein FP820_00695 [Sulfurimonas sp.]|nr:hypothetical protein [Sulfurimonas sp.]MBU3939715.1 hypothetical protein [bacterium]
MKYFFHFCISLSLFFIGEHSLLLVAQAAFLSLFLNHKQLLYILYIPVIFLALLKLFASSEYLLYFLNLLFLFYFLFKNQLLVSLKELAVFSVYMFFLYVMYRYLEGGIFNLYISSGIEDKVNHLFDEVVIFLTLLHIFIFVILGYNKQKKSRN